MQIVVQKYGGSSVADVGRIRRVAERVAATRATGAGVVVVVSAMGHTTNDLLALAKQIADVPPRRELDMLISVGERIAMTLLAMALETSGVPAISLTGSQSGILTDESHADARVVEVRPDRVRRHLDEGRVVIVAGFQGVSRDRKEVTTLGRGGSDTTAVVLAAALGAAWCEICSDVDGVFSADPRVVPDAVKLDGMSLEEVLALARGGAKVMHEEAVRYARDHGITLQARSTFGGGTGTVLSPDARAARAAVSSDDQLVKVRLVPGTADAIRTAGGRVRRVVGDVAYVDTRNAHGGLSALGDAVLGPAAVVTAVGSRLGEDLGVIEQVSAALAGAGIAVVERGASGDTAWWEVENSRISDAVRVVHASVVRTPTG